MYYNKVLIKNIYVCVLVQTKTLKFAFEIYGTLAFLFHVPKFARDIYKTVKVEEIIRENDRGNAPSERISTRCLALASYVRRCMSPS